MTLLLLILMTVASSAIAAPTSSGSMGGTVFKPAVYRELPDHAVEEGEVFTVKLTLEAWQPPMWQGVSGDIKQVVVYELLPPGVELVEAPDGAEVVKAKLSEALSTLLPSDLRVEVEGFISNATMGLVEVPHYPHLPIYMPLSNEEVTVIVVSVDDFVEYRAKVVNADKPVKVFMGSVLTEAEYRLGVVQAEVKRYCGPITGDFVLHVNAPIDLEVPEPTRVECRVNVSSSLRMGLTSITAPTLLSFVPDLEEVAVMVSERLPESLPIVFDLSEAVEGGRLSRSIKLTVVNQTAMGDLKLCLGLPQGLSLGEEQLVVKVVETPSPPDLHIKFFLQVFDLGPEASFDNPVTLNFTYTDELVFELGVDEAKLCIVYYNEEMEKWCPVESYVNLDANYVYASVSHFTQFTVAEFTKEATSLTLSVSSGEVELGSAITVYGSIAPAMNACLELVFTRPDGSTTTVEVVSDDDGSFTYSFNPEIEGSWSVKAVFGGDLEHEASVSEVVSFTVETPTEPQPTTPGCLIATAAFGSELEGPVQFLRDFRDYKVTSTKGGAAFMVVFNSWYYSWSPYVAEAEYRYEYLRQVVRCSLYPLLSSLLVSERVFDVFARWNVEAAVVAAGITAGMLISLAYISPLAVLLRSVLGRRFKAIDAGKIARVAFAWLVSSLLLHLLGLLLDVVIILELSSVCIVLASMTLTPSLVMVILPRVLRQMRSA